MWVETGFVFYEQFLAHKINGTVLYTVGKIISWAIFWLKKVVALLQNYKSYDQFSDHMIFGPKKFWYAVETHMVIENRL